jgi:hypothetical protein
LRAATIGVTSSIAAQRLPPSADRAGRRVLHPRGVVRRSQSMGEMKLATAPSM